MPTASDESLMLRLQQGEMQAFEGLYERFRRPLYNFILRLVQDPALAADLYQDTFTRLLQEARRYRTPHRVSTWLFTIAHNLCVDHLRAVRRQRFVPEGEGLHLMVSEDPEDRLVKEETLARTQQALAELSPEHRAVVLLRVMHGYSQEDTARILGVSVGTVKSRLHYALVKLREILEL